MALVKTKVPKSEHPKHGQNTHTHTYIYMYIIYSMHSTYIVDFGWNRYDIFTYILLLILYRNSLILVTLDRYVF